MQFAPARPHWSWILVRLVGLTGLAIVVWMMSMSAAAAAPPGKGPGGWKGGGWHGGGPHGGHNHGGGYHHGVNFPRNYVYSNRNYFGGGYGGWFGGVAYPPYGNYVGWNGFGYNLGYNIYGGDFGYGNFGYYGGYPYATYYTPGYAPQYVLPPVSMPAELNYGPQAVKQFMGVDRNFALGPLAQNQPPAPQPQVVVIKPKVQDFDPQARDRARQTIAAGDEQFAKEQYFAAMMKYKSAVKEAPSLAEGLYRQALAEIALGRYEEAAKTWKSAVSADPDWLRGKFRLDDLYGATKHNKGTHLEILSEAAMKETSPKKADLLMLVGAMLFLDGQNERSEKFFRASAEINNKNAPALKPAAATAPAPNEGLDL